MRWRNLAIGAVLLALTIVFIGICFALVREGSHEPEPGLVQLTHYRSQTVEPAWAPDGRHVVFVSEHEDPNPEPYSWHDKELFVVDVSSGNIKRITYGPLYKSDPAWSLDGKAIAFSSSSRLCLMRADGSHLHCLPIQSAERLAWAPDSKSLVYDTAGHIGGKIYRLRVDENEGKPVPPAEPIRQGSYAVWSPDGRCLAYSPGVSHGDVYVMNADGSNPIRLLETVKDTNPFGWSPDGRFIFISRGDSRRSQLYAISASGGNEIRLTNNAEYHSAPALSPDGTRIVFHSLRKGGYNIYLMDVHTVPPADPNAACLDRRLGHTDRHPAWSPDGAQIVFISARDGSPELYLFDVNSKTTSRLLPQVTVDPESKPSWSSDGAQLAFAAPRGGSSDSGIKIYTVQVGKSPGEPQPICLTDHPGQDAMPVWSPDGGRLAFRSDRDGGLDIYVLDLTTRAVPRLTQDSADNSPFAWSPDGTQIVFASTRNGNLDVYVMDADGSNVHRLTRDRAADSAPAWSPDGEQIIFVSDRDGNAELYVVDAGGGRATRVTNNATDDTSPAWSPDGKRLAFVSLYGVCTQSAPEK